MLSTLCAVAFSAAFAAERPTVVALGDSTTAGTPFFLSPVEAPPNGSGDAAAPYTAELQRRLPGWRVLNRGVNGETTGQILARFERDVLAEKPKHVIILAGVNDIYQGIGPEQTRHNLAELYQLCQNAGLRPIVASVLPFTRATSAQSGAIARLNVWIKKEARRRKIPYSNLHAVVADPAAPSRLKGSTDGLHPDEESYRAMGAALAGLIAALK